MTRRPTADEVTLSLKGANSPTRPQASFDRNEGESAH